MCLAAGGGALEQPLRPPPSVLGAPGLPEVVAWGDATLLGNAVEPGEGVFGDALVPGPVQVTHPADLDAKDSALWTGWVRCEKEGLSPRPGGRGSVTDT